MPKPKRSSDPRVRAATRPVREQRPSTRAVARERVVGNRLRPEREEPIRGALAGRDTPCTLPTGSGKSAIYQIAGHRIPRATSIVSPLIALQCGQVVLEENRPSLFVVDETHCTGKCRHDFRADHLRLGEGIDWVGHPTVPALTATASPRVRKDIMEHLHMRDPHALVNGSDVHAFDRPNIWLGARAYSRDADKLHALLDTVVAEPKPGIVYVSTRKKTEAIAAALEDRRIPAVAYHAGMRKAAREEAQSAFMKGDVDVLVATSAFGVGIDKPNVRFAFHHNPSDSIDSYYQEISRVGRDGEAARALLFYRPQDLSPHRLFVGGGRVDDQDIEHVTTILGDSEEPLSRKQLADATGLSLAKTARAITVLRSIDAIELAATGEISMRGRVGARALEKALRLDHDQCEQEVSRIEMMRSYAEGAGCRRHHLLGYFGQAAPALCGNCDNCASGRAAMVTRVAERTEAPQALDDEGQHARDRSRNHIRLESLPNATGTSALRPFPIDSWVRHPEWGDGVVRTYAEDKITIGFAEHTEKTLSLPLVIERSLLEPITSPAPTSGSKGHRSQPARRSGPGVKRRAGADRALTG